LDSSECRDQKTYNESVIGGALPCWVYDFREFPQTSA